VTSFKRFNSIIKPLSLFISLINADRFVHFLINEQPDVVISTHFLPAEIAAYLKRKNKIKSKLVTVITDFGIHPFWVLAGTDLYIVASSYTKGELFNNGVEKSSIRDFGIPVPSEFTKPYDKGALREKLGIARDKLNVLITTGSFGIGPVDKIVESLYRDVQLIVVCANNKRLYKRLKRKNYPGVIVFGFINNIQELMAVTDIVIAKPGGLTTSELLNMELVPIFICPIPGQETMNINALAKFGIGKFARRVEDIKEIVFDYKAHPEKLIEVKERIRRIKKPNANQDIYNVIC
jgi:processive 1,2-diacylglycerol beta-glucosyltransferase